MPLFYDIASRSLQPPGTLFCTLRLPKTKFSTTVKSEIRGWLPASPLISFIMPRVVFHLDMDAFYASVEQRDHPEWRGRPVIVGSSPERRGVVCAASYEARAFGVRSAMPSSTAGRLCPDGIFVRPRMHVYHAESQAIMEIVRHHGGENIQQVSVDEAYIETSDQFTEIPHADAALEAAVALAETMKLDIRRQRGLTATVGIAPNKLLAKIASEHRKPDGLMVILESEKVAFLQPLPVSVIRGVGAVTEKALHSAGLQTVGDIQSFTGDLRALVGSWGSELRRFAFGEDDRRVEMDEGVKSISSEDTFQKDTSDRASLRNCLRSHARDIADRLARHRLSAWTVTVKVRYSDFTTLSRQISVEEPLSSASDIYRLGCWLLARHGLVHRPLRLLGLGVSNVGEVALRQLQLFKGGTNEKCDGK